MSVNNDMPCIIVYRVLIKLVYIVQFCLLYFMLIGVVVCICSRSEGDWKEWRAWKVIPSSSIIKKDPPSYFYIHVNRTLLKMIFKKSVRETSPKHQKAQNLFWGIG